MVRKSLDYFMFWITIFMYCFQQVARVDSIYFENRSEYNRFKDVDKRYECCTAGGMLHLDFSMNPFTHFWVIHSLWHIFFHLWIPQNLLLQFQKFIKNQPSLGYEFLAGQRHNSKILYVPIHECLYVKKRTKKNSTDYICYQTVLAKSKTKNANKTIPICTATVKIDKKGICTMKEKPHVAHECHEVLYRDMKTKNNFLDEVATISKQLENLPIEVSNRDIFTRELSK